MHVPSTICHFAPVPRFQSRKRPKRPKFRIQDVLIYIFSANAFQYKFDNDTDSRSRYSSGFGWSVKNPVWWYIYCCVCVWLLYAPTSSPRHRTSATVPSFGWRRAVDRAAGHGSASGPRFWCRERGCASSVSRWWWAAATWVVARVTAVGAPGTEFWAARRAGRPWRCPAAAASGWWRRRTPTVAVPPTISTASCSSELCRTTVTLPGVSVRMFVNLFLSPDNV